MNVSALFIRRPVMTTLVMVAILLFGVMAYFRLPVNDLPNVDFPTISVRASLAGASPETMAAAVATPLEKQFSTIAGIDSMSSESTLGNTRITLQFVLSRDLDAAAQDVQAAISQATRYLPADMSTPPYFRKVNPADQAILYIALTSPTLPLPQLDEYGQTLMAQRISMVPGVAQVSVYGSQKYAVRVRLNPNLLASRGIGIDEVAAAINAGNSNLPTGALFGKERTFTVEATGQLNDAAAYRPLIVAYRAGRPVRLEELGDVIDSVENDKVAAWYVTKESMKRSVMLAIQRQPGTNTIEVAQSVRALLPTFRAQLPASVDLQVLYDRSESIQESVNDVQFTLLLTLVLVILVIFLFLRNLSATLLPSMALPMSIVGTFTVMYLLDYSLDNLSLLALTLSVGFVVDDAIVMVENVIRHLEMGKPRLQAALDGSKEVGFTIVSMTVSLAAVFIPVLFMGGLIGRLFREFAVTIGMAVIVSGFVSLTLTPMLASRWLSPPGQGKASKNAYAASEKVFQFFLDLYGKTLNFVLNHQPATLVLSVAVLAATVWLFIIIPKGFIPSQDINQLFGTTQGAEGVSPDAMREHQLAVTEIIRQDPNVAAFMSNYGGSYSGGGNTGRLFIRLKPRHERELTADQVVASLRGKLASVPGISAFIQSPPAINVGGRVSKSQYQFTLQGPDIEDLYQRAAELESAMTQLPGFLDVTSDLQIKNPKIRVNINRDRASALQVTAQQVEAALSYAYGSRYVSTILASNNQHYVIMELDPKYQMDPLALGNLYVRAGSGDLVPLSAVAGLEPTVGPLSVSHSGQLPAVTLSFNLDPAVSIGEAVDRVNALARQLLPASISTSFQGTAQAFQSSMTGMGLLLIMSILVIYLVLGILYESFIHPITILTALPFAGFGALLTLLVFKVELSIYAYVGIIMLVGLVKKNGIMMVDFALEAQKQGKDARAAIYDACLTRFRPIMMTTFCALMAGLPIALGFGAGAEARRPLGLAVVGGLIFSQSLTLFVTPVFFLFMETLREKLGRSSAKS